MAETTGTLADLKTMIGPAADKQEDILKLIIRQTESQLRLRIHKKASEAIPAELAFVVTDVAMRRFNRVGDEGKSASSQDGLSTTWQTNDFDDYADDIATWLTDQAEHTSLGRATFINAYGGGSHEV